MCKESKVTDSAHSLWVINAETQTGEEMSETLWMVRSRVSNPDVQYAACMLLKWNNLKLSDEEAESVK